MRRPSPLPEIAALLTFTALFALTHLPGIDVVLHRTQG